jgi:Rrf2 family protein
MAANTRFATGVHALVLLALEPDTLQTSETVAKRLNTNPVVIRRVFSLLQQAELVRSQKGPSGGSRLGRPAKEITLADIYRALEPTAIFHAAAVSGTTASKVTAELDKVVRKAEAAMIAELEQTSLNHVAKKFARGVVKTA